MKPRLYLETTIPSYLVARTEPGLAAGGGSDSSYGTQLLHRGPPEPWEKVEIQSFSARLMV